MNTTKLLDIDNIIMDERTQPREKIDQEMVKEYAELLRGWTPDSPLQEPPLKKIRVVCDGTSNWLIDGWHRILAAKELGLGRYPAIVETGTFDDAIWRSYGMNAEHGMRRTNKEKRRAVEAALRHPNAQGQTDSVIAANCRVSQVYIVKVRAEMAVTEEMIRNELVIGKNGKQYKPHAPKLVKPVAMDSENSVAQESLVQIVTHPTMDCWHCPTCNCFAPAIESDTQPDW